MRLRHLLFPLAIFLLAPGPLRASDGAPSLEQLDLFAAVLARIERFYVDPLERQALVQAAVEGMLTELDPASVYLPPESYRGFVDDIHGEYVGVGIRIEPHERGLLVLEAFESGPAHRAGLAPEDIIVAVDGVPVLDQRGGDPTLNIRGPAGTSVTLSIERGAERFEREVLREAVHPPAVTSSWLEPGVAWVRIHEFQQRSGRELIGRMKELRRAGLEAVILDLRDNPGGSLSEAVEMANLFLGRGVIVSTRGRGGEVIEERARPGGTLKKLRLVVLQNENSASASEILAGALRDHRRALIVGAKSFGKGTVQQVFPLSNGGGVKITVARYFLPSGRTIDHVGIDPDVQVPVGGRAELEAWQTSPLRERSRTLLSSTPGFPDDLRLAAARVLLDEPGLAQQPPGQQEGPGAAPRPSEGEHPAAGESGP
jgi:carboxyl-terminal processing protease